MTGKIKKVTKVEEETGRETIQRALKHGSLQDIIDKGLDKLGDAPTAKAVELLKRIHPGAEIASPGVDALLKTGIISLFAEVAGAGNILGSKIPGVKKVDEEKYTEIAAYLRSYAGQRLGSQSANAVFAVAPIFADMLSNPALADILKDSDEKESSIPQLTEGEPEERLDIEKELAKLGGND